MNGLNLWKCAQIISFLVYEKPNLNQWAKPYICVQKNRIMKQLDQVGLNIKAPIYDQSNHKLLSFVPNIQKSYW